MSPHAFSSCIVFVYGNIESDSDFVLIETAKTDAIVGLQMLKVANRSFPFRQRKFANRFWQPNGLGGTLWPYMLPIIGLIDSNFSEELLCLEFESLIFDFINFKRIGCIFFQLNYKFSSFSA